MKMCDNFIVFSFFYNRGNVVSESISSLINATPKNSKVVLVNDGSTDDTLKQLLRFKNNPKVEIINQENQGFTVSLVKVINEKLIEYEPEYFAIHGAGDICHSEKFEKQLSYMENHPDVVACGTGYEIVSKDSNITLNIIEGYHNATKNTLYETVPFTHGTVVYRKDAYLKSGGYNINFKCCQDWDLYFRLIEHGRIVRYPEVLYTKYLFDNGVSHCPRKRAEQMRYKTIALTKARSDKLYMKKLNLLEKEGIIAATNDYNFLAKYKATQLSLIIRGELKLAQEWQHIIESEYPTQASAFIRRILNILITLKFPRIIIAKFYAFYKKIKLKK